MSNRPRPLQRSPLALHLSLLIASMAAFPCIALAQDAAADAPRADAKTLDTVSVFGTLDSSISAGSKDGTSLKETPKSVTVMTNERIEAQNLTDLQEILTQATGVTVGAYSPLDSFVYSRGFRVQTVQFDGGAPAYTYGFGFYYTPDAATLDQVQMLRGVDGIYSGAGEPGGVINMVRKRPQQDFAASLNLSAGSWQNYRGQFDVTGPLTEDGRLRGRAVVALGDRNYFWDRANNEKQVVYGALEYDITDTMLLNVGATHEKRDEGAYVGWSGMPRYSDGSSLGLPRSTNFATDWSRWDQNTKELFANVQQKYGNNGTIKLNTTQLRQDSVARYTTVYGFLDEQANIMPKLSASHNEYTSKQTLIDLSASDSFELFGRSHRYTVGTDYAKLDGGGQRAYDVVGYGWASHDVDVFNYDHTQYPDAPSVLSSYYPVLEQAQRGYYAALSLQLADPLRLTIGGRYGEYRYYSVQNIVGGNQNISRYSDTAFIPSAALSFNLSDKWTTYLSYGENYKPQAGLLKGPLPGTSLDPVTGDSLELGIKGEIFQRLNFAAAIYRVQRIGQGQPDSSFPGAPIDPNNGNQCCYRANGDVQSKGFDLEVSGLVLPGWQLFAGYTYVNTSFNATDEAWRTGAWAFGRTPKHVFKAWSTWRLPDNLSRWTINTGVIAQSASYMDGSAPIFGTVDDEIVIAGWQPYRNSQGGYALWNASVQYEISDTWTVGIYGENLTDRTYYTAVGGIDGENVYGTPRNYNFTLKGRW
ncbi:TonB-dependent siderophore receptor [Luteimonas sp. RIT-PG2_3]|jgi:TonB-dependent siderophore receptor